MGPSCLYDACVITVNVRNPSGYWKLFSCIGIKVHPFFPIKVIKSCGIYIHRLTIEYDSASTNIQALIQMLKYFIYDDEVPFPRFDQVLG